MAIAGAINPIIAVSTKALKNLGDLVLVGMRIYRVVISRKPLPAVKILSFGAIKSQK
jgi:hypothetical protein